MNRNHKELCVELDIRARACALRYLNSEKDLIDILQELDLHKAFVVLNFPSLYAYAVQALNLSDGTAYNLIQIARKSVKIPELKKEIKSGGLSVSNARRIAPILT